MDNPIRAMVEFGKKKRVVAVALDWPGWDRSARTEDEALRVFATYRLRYAKVAAVAGLADEFAAAGEVVVVERIAGIGMTDYYGMSGAWVEAEHEQLSEAACERRIALLEAAWDTLDTVASRVSAELRKGPRGGGRERDQIIRHANGAEIYEFAPKVGVRVPLETRDDPQQLLAYRAAVLAGIRSFNARGASAGRWPVQYLIRRCAWHMLDHAWEMEDRDLSAGS